MSHRFLTFSVTLLLSSAVGISQVGPFQVRYASNLMIGDSVINIANTGSGSTTSFPGQNGNICANVYAFTPDEQLLACCACALTPGALKSISVRSDLIPNTLTPFVPTSIVIKLVASAGPICNASAVGTGTNLLSLGMVAFGTTIHALPVTVDLRRRHMGSQRPRSQMQL